MRAAGLVASVRTSRPLRRALRSRIAAVVVATVVLLTVVGRVDAAARVRRHWGATAAVLVLIRDLPAGSLVTPADVTATEWPIALTPVDALASLPADRRLSADVVQGEVLVAHRVGDVGRGAWASTLGEDEVAVQLPLREPAPGVAVGDLVDVVAPSSATVPDAMAQLRVEVVAHDARVLDIGEATVTLAVRRTDATAAAGAALGGLVTLVVQS